MFQRFTEEARRAVVYAQEEARLLRHRHIAGEHLLLGLLRAEPSLLGCPVATVREAIIARDGLGEPVTPSSIPFTPEAKHALEVSLKLSLAGDEEQISPAHVLLGVLDADPTVEELIADVGQDLRVVREHAAAMAAAAPPVGPLEAMRAGHPVAVTLGHGPFPLGDLGNRRVDARLLLLMLRADTPMGRWLRSRGIDEDAILAEVPSADDEDQARPSR